MIIRIAKNSDLDTINSIRIEYSQGLINHSDIPNHLGFITFVGIIDDSVIGYISLSPETEKDQYSNEVFLSVFIKSKFQGNKYGPQLIAKAIEHSENSKFANGSVEIAKKPERIKRNIPIPTGT